MGKPTRLLWETCCMRTRMIGFFEKTCKRKLGTAKSRINI